ncbi:F-box associated domain containing protein [Tanacetum coccineum]
MTLEISHSFPPEIIREILLKLPVESLLRCKSVCKDWYSLISEQYFITTHYTLSSTNNINYAHHRLIYNTFDQTNNLISCPLYDVLFHKSVSNALELENPLQRTLSRGFRIVGSCNGLMCLLEEFKDTLFIYNPTTRRSNLLRRPHRLDWEEVDYLGFGYDELSHDYKVVITTFELKMPTIIYSLKTGKWKEIGHFPCADLYDNGKPLNGALHWVALDSTSLDPWKIVSLDLANETYGEVLQPDYHKGYNYLELGVSGDWLCVLCDYVGNRVVDLWVMKVYGVKDSWTKLASIPYPDHLRGQTWAPLCISKDGKLMLQFGLQLLIYDSKDSSSSMIENKNYDACIVVESLVSPFPPLGLADNNDDDD